LSQIGEFVYSRSVGFAVPELSVELRAVELEKGPRMLVQDKHGYHRNSNEQQHYFKAHWPRAFGDGSRIVHMQVSQGNG
jgi:hypothetical protein